MDNAVTPERINQAIEDHFGLWWTDESKQNILADVGPDGLARIEEISAVANDPDLWIYAASTDQAYEQAKTLLREQFPLLSEAAVTRIATSAAYGWK